VEGGPGDAVGALGRGIAVVLVDEGEEEGAEALDERVDARGLGDGLDELYGGSSTWTAKLSERPRTHHLEVGPLG
jgi:hypothetical protein